MKEGDEEKVDQEAAQQTVDTLWLHSISDGRWSSSVAIIRRTERLDGEEDSEGWKQQGKVADGLLEEQGDGV